MAEEITYVYCLTKKPPKLKEVENLMRIEHPSTGSGQVALSLHFIYHCGLYVTVSKVKQEEFNKENLSKNLADMDWVKTRITIHEKVIEGVMKHTAVLPFKFATLFNSERSLKLFLEEHAQTFRENLEYLTGKEEWGVKVYGDMERLKECVSKEEAEILKIDEEIHSSSRGKAYLLKKKREQLLKDALSKRISENGQKSFEVLKRLSLEVKINKLLPKEVTEREDDMVLNSAFLVDKSKVAEFIQTAEELKAQYNGEGFSFDCTGPWPAYNFCALSR